MMCCTEGYGICLSELTHEIHMSKLLKLIKTAPNFYNKMKADFDENWEISLDELDDPFDVLSVWVELYGETNCGGLAAILQAVIKEKENVAFDVVEDVNGNAYLVFAPQYPWMTVTEEEKALTEDKIDAIIEKYLSIATTDALYPCFYSIETE